MGQVLSMIWRWVRPKARGSRTIVGRGHDGGNEEPDHLIIPLNEQPRRRDQSHCIDIFDPRPLSESDAVEASHDHNLVPTMPSDSVVVFLRSGTVEEEGDAKPNEKEVRVVAEDLPNTKAKDTSTVEIIGNQYHSGVSVSSSSKLNGRGGIGPYTSKQRILLVGEGDFSFSACLAIAFGSASNMVATSLNSLDFLTKNYGNFPTNRSELETRGSVVLHGVDATKMARHPQLALTKFDCVIFNFPHAGFKQLESPESQIRRHQKLVRSFLRNAKKMIEEDGQILVTHKSNAFFLKWGIPKLGTDQGLHLIQEVKFKRSEYPGYHTKYGYGGDKDFDCNPSKTYKFGLTSQE